MADVFISYSHHDRVTAGELARFLDSCGYSVWWDYELVGGSRFRKEIKTQLDGARAAVVIWTAHSIESEFVLDEADDARSQGKLLPVRHPDLDFKQVPLGFRGLQTDPLTKPELILRSLDALGVKPSREPTRQREPVVIAERKVEPGDVEKARQFADWEFIKDSDDPAKLRSFEATWPNSPLVELARARLAKLAERRWAEIARTEDPKTVTTFAADFAGTSTHSLAVGVLQRLEGRAWYALADKGDRTELQRFIETYPNGSFAAEARHRLDALLQRDREAAAWADVSAAPTVAKLEGFLAAFPLGANAERARGLLSDLMRANMRARRWSQVKETRSVDQLRAFIREYETGAEVEEARGVLAARLREREETAWATVAGAENPLPVLQFLEAYPDGHRAAEAIRLIDEMPGKIRAEVKRLIAASPSVAARDAGGRWLMATAAGGGKTAKPLVQKPKTAEKVEAAVLAITPDQPRPRFGWIWIGFIAALIGIACFAAYFAMSYMQKVHFWPRAWVASSIAGSIALLASALALALVIYMWRVARRWSSSADQLSMLGGHHAIACAFIVIFIGVTHDFARGLPSHPEDYSIWNVDTPSSSLYLLAAVFVGLAILQFLRVPYAGSLYCVLFSLFAAAAAVLVVLTSVWTPLIAGPIASNYMITYGLFWYGGLVTLIAWVTGAVHVRRLRSSTPSGAIKTTT